MSDLDIVVTTRLLAVIDDQEWHERAIAQRLRTDETKALYAPLFDRAAAFWLELGMVVESGRTPDRDQAMAITYLREPIEQDALGLQRKHRVRATRTTKTMEAAS